MMNKEVLPIEGIIARLDNDFNIMTSDYIPRVATWCIDAMNEMGILQYEKKEMVVEVHDRIAEFPCCVNAFSVYVDGCEIPNAKESKSCCNQSRTYYFEEDKSNTKRSRRVVEPYPEHDSNRNYVYVQSNNSIELNFDVDKVTVKYLSVKSVYSKTFHCDIPVIPNNGKLVTALEWYCM